MAKQSPAPDIDSPIFIMVSYLIVKIISRKTVAMSTASHRLERIAFVFTKRTSVRLGGFDMHI